ncbi:MAG: histidine kinase [Flavipsychrobacter sp.]
MVKRLIVFIAALLIAHPMVAQLPFAKDHWLNESNTVVKVNALLQDEHTGYMWLGTDEGLFRYNGKDFVPIPTPIKEPVTALANHEEKVWVGYKNGVLAEVVHGRLTTIDLKDKAPVTPITNIYIQAKDSIWLCTEGEGLRRIIGDTVTAFTTKDGLSDDFVYTVLATAPNRIMAATDRGINELIFQDGKLGIAKITTSSGLPDNIVRTVRPIPNMCWSWIGTHEGGLALYCSISHGVWTPSVNTKWEWGAVNDILPLNKTEAWVATASGYLLKATIKDSVALEIEPIHFRGQKLKRLVRDHSGNIWCATNTGIKEITAAYLMHIPLSAPYRLGEVAAITCDMNNTIWYAQGKRLYSIDKNGKQSEQFTAPVSISSLYADMHNNVWMGTLGEGVYYRNNNGRVSKVNTLTPLNNKSVLDITGTDDRIWVAGLHGVEELTYPTKGIASMSLVKLHNKAAGTGSDYIYELFADKKGRVWMATDGAGVTMYDGKKYYGWGEEKGMKSKVVYSITEDAMGCIWAATLKDGLLVYNDTVWGVKDKKNGLSDLSISAMATNATGEVVIINGKGADEWYPRCKEFKHYSRRQGFGIDSFSGVLNLITRDKEGNVYVPYEEGILKFRNIEQDETIAPKVNITSVSVFFNDVPFGKEKFVNSDNHISFSFDGISFANPEAVIYRYKLNGYNDMWIYTSDQSVTFPQLSSGEYEFLVQASMNTAFENAATASYKFIIQKPFWKEVWFIVLLVALIWAISYTYIKLRERNLQKLAKLERERMLFEYEHLKSQVNPHFLFNSLNTLSSLIEDDKNMAQDYTVHLSDMYRSMLTFKDKDLMPLKDELEVVSHYMYIQKSRFGDAIQLNVNVSEEVKQQGKVVPLALQLLVENAIKHNIVSQAQPLIINIDADKEYIKVSNTLQAKMSKEKGAGLGLVNIRRRYSLLTDRRMTYGMNENEFVVLLPLL